MKQFKLTGILLLCGMIFSSCGQNTSPAEIKPAQIETTTAASDTTSVVNSKDRLGSYDFGGKTFTILGREYAKLGNLPSYEFSVDTENGDLINDTIYKRNLIVEEQYNVVIKSQQAASGQSASTVEKSQMAGDGAYDLVWAHVNDMSSLVMKGLLADYNSIPGIDISQPWWNQLATKSLTMNGHCYLQMNYIPFTGVMLSHCLYFNKAMAKDNGIDNLYELVKNNKWDFDTFSTLVKSVSRDVDGNSVFDDKDTYGLAASHGTSGVAFSIAMGTKPIKTANDGSFELTMLSDRNKSILEKIVALTSDNSTYLITDYSLENDLAKMFANGQALFYSGFLTDSYQFFRGMEQDFGLLPFPKYDSEQENYITTVTGGTGLLGVPKYVADTNMVGIVTEALAIESYNYVYPAIYDTVFTEKLLRDSESKEMFDILMDSLEIDFGRTFKYAAYSDLLGDLVAKGSTDLASAVASVSAQAEQHYSDVIKLYFEDN